MRAPTETEKWAYDASMAAVKEYRRLFGHAYSKEEGMPDGGMSMFIVRAVIKSLRQMAEDTQVYDAFAGDGVIWKDRTSQSVLLRYLDIASPPFEYGPQAKIPDGVMKIVTEIKNRQHEKHMVNQLLMEMKHTPMLRR